MIKKYILIKSYLFNEDFIEMIQKKNLSYKLIEYGIGKKTISNISKKFGINNRLNFLKLKKKHYSNTENFLKKIKYIKGRKLKENIKRNIDFVINFKNYRGIRHKFKYPVRGQRTHTNAKTAKKSRKIVINKKNLLKKKKK